ncbi:MAG: D-alanine--D-alanine ligase [Candidatus Omnitrophota bacterium]|nr:D-alanine--D-alanine ligase [Candidatus Omnitrophota bacterium]
MYRAKDFGKVAVLAGGPSSERAISIKSGRAVYASLKASGCDVEWVDLNGYGFRRTLRRISPDIAFLALHGRFGEDGTVQRILEEISIPYTGSGVIASYSALDKIASKKIFEKNGIPIPPYKVFNRRNIKNAKSISFPLVVKPQNEGSSIGLSVVRNKKEFTAACREAFKYSKNIIVEKFIKGREITVGILDNAALPVVEIVPHRDFYDFYAKYKDKNTEYVVPAPLARAAYIRAQKLGLASHNALKCKDFSRVDMILGDDGNMFVLEVNTIPGLTARSLLPKAAGAVGITFSDLCLKFLNLARKNKGRKY